MEKSQRIDKAARLIEYLTRLADLRRKSVKDIVNYNQVLWLHDIPKKRGCFTQIWGGNSDYDDSVWLEVQSRREPPVPKIPNMCQDWVDQEALYRKTDVPLLRDAIVRQVENENWSEDSDQPQFFSEIDRLADHPDVSKKWEQYVEQKWISWSEEHNEWESIQKVYTRLFTIYQEQVKLGEEYELIVGAGLLTWQTPETHQIQRHLLVATASLEFESRLGKFTVRPNADGASLRPELEMLEGNQPPKAEEIAKEGLRAAEDNPWDRSSTDGVLKGLVHSIDSKGEYDERLVSKASRNSDKPIVEYAPALVLRKRSVRGLTEILRKLKIQIEAGEDIPVEFEDLAEIQQNDDSQRDGDAERIVPLSPDDEIYFPKPSNKEQRQIIEKLNHSNGVLVQGPPGTGKTHTIANLICHLLATGQRILVTAKTPRALRVIEDQLPEQVRPLCVNLLGSGLEEQEALRNSMGSVLQKTQSWDPGKRTASQKMLEKQLKALRSERAEVEARLRIIRESETHSQVVADGAYRGTAAHVARAVKADSTDFEWFKDEVPFDADCPVEARELLSFLNGLRFFTEEKRSELKLSRPASLPVEESLLQLFENEKTAQQEVTRTDVGGHAEFSEQLRSLDEKSLISIVQALSRIRNLFQKLQALPHKWIGSVLLDMSAGHDSAWRELHAVTEAGISEISDIVKGVDSVELLLPEDFDPKMLRKDAESLKEIMAADGNLGWGPFRSGTVRPLIYLTKKVRIDGQKCKSLEQITILADVLHVQLQLKHLWNFWKGRADFCEGPYGLQFREIEAHGNALREALSLVDAIDRCREIMPGRGNNPSVAWHDESSINQFIQSCKLALAKLNKGKAEAAIREVILPIQSLSKEHAVHPVVFELLTSIENRSADGFVKAKQRLLKLEEELALLKETERLREKIDRYTPVMVANILESCDEEYWVVRLQAIEKIWSWARAKSWMNDFINKEDAIGLAQRVTQIESGIEAATAKLASNKAWSFCFSRMSGEHRREMEAWQQSMRRLGKGTGKYASKNRRDAQRHLNECREAVPAWVMPLHRVWDTIDPSSGMFDVIIIDEASQCGMEALPLLYLGKKILIVGDDKQIAPDAVGVPRDAVHRLAEEFLYDYKFKESFDVEASLFDQGKLRYTTRRISLREHFRCMPEIIRFSNDLCYSGEPLIPLRQFGADRLKPLRRVHVQNGYREGKGGRVVNRPEAKVIADKIVELCSDSRYAEKSMGVVILQGEAQASLIENILLERLGAEEMEKRRLICGNPYSFQGDERDIIFLSMVAAPNERIGPLAKPADERRFNVAASRAKDQMWLFHSVTQNDLSQSCLRSKLLAFFEEPYIDPIVGVDHEKLERQVFDTNRAVVKAPDPFDSWFEVDVALELARRKYRVIPQFEVAGKYIDLVVDGGGPQLAVECDGDAFHDAEHYEKDMERQKELERCKRVFFRIRECEFYSNKNAVLSRLWRALKDRGIFPIGMEPFEEDAGFAENEGFEGEAGNADTNKPPDDLFSGGTESEDPRDIHEAMQMKYPALRDAIIATLKSRPHQACVKSSVVKFLLQYLEIISRGKPREAFAYKIDQVLHKMDKAGVLEIYTATNERVKLASEPYLSMALGKDLL